MTAKTTTTLARRLVPGCCLLLLLASAVVLAQEDGGYDDEDDRGQRSHPKNDDSLDAANATIRCWYCVGRFRSWADCQRVNEVDYCEPEQPGGEVRCLTSSILIEKANGDRKWHRYAGCALNETALQDLYLETFEVSFNQTSAMGPNITLQEFNVCTGTLCNVMDQEAFRRGSGRVVKLTMPGAASLAGINPFVTVLTALLGVVFAMK
uniref:(northern house mosquito) hypothetical protein n=1 Tax=Culex pipiens TaxID=7175 RepID=A0A8D8DHC3_CULPI